MSDKTLGRTQILWDLKWLGSVNGVKLKGAKLSVLVMAMSFANWPEWKCFPSVRRLAEAANTTEDTARDAMRELIDLGLVDRTIRPNCKTNIYCINVELIHETATKHKAERNASRKAANRRPARDAQPNLLDDAEDDVLIDGFGDDEP